MQTAGSDEFMTLGKITGAFGIKGWCTCQSFTEPQSLLFACDTWWLKKKNNDPVVVKPIHHQAHKKHYIVALEELTDRTQALNWQHSDILVKKSQLPKLLDNEYYLEDLIGFNVINLKQISFGTVERFFATGAHEIMVVKHNAQDLLIPFVKKHIIKTIEHDKKIIVVDWELDYS